MGSFSQHGFCLFCSQSVQEERKHEEILALKKNKTQKRLQEFSWLYWWRKLQIPKGLAPGVIITKSVLQTPQTERGKGEIFIWQGSGTGCGLLESATLHRSSWPAAELAYFSLIQSECSQDRTIAFMVKNAPWIFHWLWTTVLYYSGVLEQTCKYKSTDFACQCHVTAEPFWFLSCQQC